MSTRDVLNTLVAAKRVIHMPPQLMGVSESRYVFLEAKIGNRLLSSVYGKSSDSIRLAQLLQNIDQFSSGRFISFGEHPFDKDNGAYMARTSPIEAGIFDIRCREKPAYRIFGAFTGTDTFVGLTLRSRKELGGKEEPMFSEAIAEALLVWSDFFPNHAPFVSAKLEEHVSQNVYPV